ncbi:MAG: phosphomannomutase/phosphoglucomutase [Faecalibacterium sp.]|nr:phosphomannomutase/phosphoglucomutase [Ruminococcus sp.]MCM1392245.1 phosphomannomutase/phosphoglucomutase [Ruminococcus sp.]MCM1484948.1 phosphomannomutase/phosphoglucomutase [Faecalibacterium sp.]
MTKLDLYKKLKSGTDIRGIAVETENGKVELTDEAVFDLTAGFCQWLFEKGIERGAKVSVGHDSRISAERIKAQVIKALTSFGFAVIDCSYASTPAMFMTTVDLGCAAAVQITASHHPFDRNGLKFFTTNGGLDGADIERLIVLASDYELPNTEPGIVKPVDYMSDYAKRLRDMICREVNAENYEKPLENYKIVVDAGNGVGGFYASEVLAPLGADIKGSQFLEPDGMFPNHIPNPENKQAMESVSAATVNNKADLGIIFDTDVDRAGCVDEHGNEINRNRLVALASIIALEGNEGGTIVTDSVTSTGLTDFINNTLGGVHYRFKRGYRNVINRQIELNNDGVNCPLAIETSGHAALRENYYLDDGAYLVTKIVIKMAQMGKEGKKLESLISELKDPVEACELRPKILCDDFRAYGNDVIASLEEYARNADGWTLADDNREGLRIFLDENHGNGWFLLRLSVHDPIMPLNAESDSVGGVKIIIKQVLDFLRTCDKLDISMVENY